MDETRKTQLECAGVDVDEALNRFMGNEPLMMKFLLRFPADENFPKLKQAIACHDTSRAFEAAHTLKGVTGNLSLKALYELLVPLVEDLRGGDLAAASARMPELEAKYAQVAAVLGQLA